MIKCDKAITLRINSQLLEDFKKCVGNNYQVKIKELMSDYVHNFKKLNDIFEQEEIKRNMYRK